MIAACHQPNYLPWSGFFYKALVADCVVLLDEVQFPRGFSWVNRNRIKGDQGELWLTVPVWKKGRGLQKIGEVEICYEKAWRLKHLQSLEQHYVHAPYRQDYLPLFQEIYSHPWKRLPDFNVDLIRCLGRTLGVAEKFVLQSSLGIKGRGPDLLVNACNAVGADTYAASSACRKFLNEDLFSKGGIRVAFYRFTPPVYPQLWDAFIEDLSFVDLLLNCGEKARDILLGHKAFSV